MTVLECWDGRGRKVEAREMELKSIFEERGTHNNGADIASLWWGSGLGSCACVTDQLWALICSYLSLAPSLVNQYKLAIYTLK